MSHLRKRGPRGAMVAVSVAAATALASSVAAAGGGGQKIKGTAYLGTTPKPGALIYAAGFAQDNVLGSAAVTYTIKPLSQTSGTILAKAQKVTIWTKNGSLSGTGSATVTITNKPKSGDATVTGGKLSLTHGTGGQAGHSEVATFTGHGNVVNGHYVFDYKGTYK